MNKYRLFGELNIGNKFTYFLAEVGEATFKKTAESAAVVILPNGKESYVHFFNYNDTVKLVN